MNKRVIVIMLVFIFIGMLIGYQFLTEEMKAVIIFFGGILAAVIASGILIAVGIKALVHK